MNTGNRVLQLPVRTREMYASFSPDRSRLLTGGDGANPKVQVWDVENGECLATFSGHRGPIAALAWSRDQRWVASGAIERDVRVWDLESGGCVCVLEGVAVLKWRRAFVRSVEFGPSNDRLICGGGDGVVRLCELPGGRLLQKFKGHSDGVYHAIFDDAQSRVLTGSRDRNIRLWDASTGRCLKVIEGAGSHHIQCLAWHKDQRRFLSSGAELRLWDTETGQCLREFHGHTETIRSVTWSDDQREIVSASHDRSVRIWDVDSGRCTQVFEGHQECVVNAVWSRDQKHILSCDSSGGLRHWTARD